MGGFYLILNAVVSVLGGWGGREEPPGEKEGASPDVTLTQCRVLFEGVVVFLST